MRMRHLHSLALSLLRVFALLARTGERDAGEERRHDDENDQEPHFWFVSVNFFWQRSNKVCEMYRHLFIQTMAGHMLSR